MKFFLGKKRSPAGTPDNGAMTAGIRQRLVFPVVAVLLTAMMLVGVYRYGAEKRELLHEAEARGEHAAGLIADLAAPYFTLSDPVAMNTLVQNFLNLPEIHEIAVTDENGRVFIHASRPNPGGERLRISLPVKVGSATAGNVALTIYPADLDRKLRSSALKSALGQIVIFLPLAGLVFWFVSRAITRRIKKLETAVTAMIDRKDFTQRIDPGRNDEVGRLAQGVNYLVERLEQFILEMGAISVRINELSPSLAADSREMKKNAESEADAILSVSTSVGEMSAAIDSINESAESLSRSAGDTSSAILEMNASNQEVARHTSQLTSSVEDVTTSVMEMIASIREVAAHVDTLSAAAEDTASSSVQIEATIREVERGARESARLSEQVSVAAKDRGARSIQETMHAMNAIKESVTRYSGIVQRLGKRTEEIGKILSVIVEVTERTNLLALNASILAAQAGEHGKGFAVVAGEIKALADRTAGSAQDIAKMITAVQHEAKEAVAAMGDSLNAVEGGVQRSRDAGAALDHILVSASRSAETATMIERAMSEQARGIKQVSEAVANVKRMTSQIASATQAQNSGTGIILKASEGMRDIGRRVALALTEQGRGGKQIAQAAESVSASAAAIASGTREQRQASRQILNAMERVQDLPRETIKRIGVMAGAVKLLGEQAALLNQELSTITVRQGARSGKRDSIRMGVIPLEAPAEMYRRFTPLASYLTKTLGRQVELAVGLDFASTVQDIETGVTDIAFLTPTTYIEARDKSGVVLLAKALRKGVPYTHSAVVIRSGNGIERLEDLRGKRFAFGDRMSTSSFLIPRHMLHESGVALEELKEFQFLGHHDDVARGVLSGEYDAGGLMESTAAKFTEQGLKILKTSMEVPEFNISASKHLDVRMLEALRSALVKLDSSRSDQAEILSLIDRDYTGFTEARDGDYDVIRKIMAGAR